MATLSSSIVKRQIASMKDVEEALARQVLYGGDLATNLLELAAVSEADLTALLAESYGIHSAPVGELPRAPEATRRLVPGELALRHGLYPLNESNATLVIAVSEPLAAEVEQDLSFSLGVAIEQLAAPLVRIRQAIARDYGVGMDRRTMRLIAKLEGRPDPSPSSFPPRLSEPPSLTPTNDLPTVEVPPTPVPADATALDIPIFEDLPDSEPIPISVADAFPDSGAVAEQPPAPLPAEPAAASPARASSDREAPARLANWASSTSRPPPRRRRVGPYTVANAEQDLLDAGSRDEVLRAFVDFAAQYFEYAALFAVQGDLAEGRDAHGPGTEAARVANIGVPLDLPSTLSDARREGRYKLARLSNEGLDSQLAKDLKRKPGRVVLVLPIVMRGRCVLLLYGDHGEADVELESIGGVIAFAPLVATALENVILKRKLATRPGVPAALLRAQAARRRPATPNKEARAAALAAALGAPSTSSRPPPPQPSPTPPPPAISASSPAPAPAVSPSSPPFPSPSPKPASAPPPIPARTPRPPAATAPKPPPKPSPTPPPKPQIPIHPTPPQGTPRQISTSRAPPKAAPIVVSTQAAADDGWDTPAHAHRTAARLQLVPDEGVAAEAERAPDSADMFEERPSRTDGAYYEAPKSHSEAYPARRPQPRHSSEEMRLPSVIVDVEQDVRELLEQLLEGSTEAADRLVELGEPAIGPLVAVFPGPITNELRRGADAPRASECGPVLRALARIGDPAVPFILVRTADTDPKVRAWATRLLGEVATAESARAVVRRFTDADPDVRRAALAAGRLMQNSSEARAAIRDGLCELATAPAQTKEVRHYAIEALADLRDPRAVPRLIRLLDERSAEIVRSTSWALVVLTRTDYGRDTSGWTQWWQKNGTRHRIEWLIDALMHDDAKIRREAGDELKAITKEYFGYYDDLPKKERAKAQERYREWWESKGKARFRT